MDIIDRNPYRCLGVFSNSPARERAANKGRISAFAKVGKPVPFPLDLPGLLPAPERTAEAAARAEAELTLPADRVRFAQFWWMSLTPLDKVAFGRLADGDADAAEALWEKKDNVSSLQNRFVLLCIRKDWAAALRCAEALYSGFSGGFAEAVAGKEAVPAQRPLWHTLLDSLAAEGVELPPLAGALGSAEWKSYIAEKAAAPLAASLAEATEAAKAARGGSPAARLRAGRKLVSAAKAALPRLKKLLPAQDIRLQTAADRAATEILQCGIDYYNGSDDEDSAAEALKLAEYALSIAEGPMARQRCGENAGVLRRKAAELPPASVMPQYKAVRKAVREYGLRPRSISSAVTLLEAAGPPLSEMKAALGPSGAACVSRLSTSVVSSALGGVIDEVNAAQQEIPRKAGEIDAIIALSYVLKEAWKATLLMDGFDMEPDFKAGRYAENR